MFKESGHQSTTRRNDSRDGGSSIIAANSIESRGNIRKISNNPRSNHLESSQNNHNHMEHNPASSQNQNQSKQFYQQQQQQRTLRNGELITDFSQTTTTTTINPSTNGQKNNLASSASTNSIEEHNKNVIDAATSSLDMQLLAKEIAVMKKGLKEAQMKTNLLTQENAQLQHQNDILEQSLSKAERRTKEVIEKLSMDQLYMNELAFKNKQLNKDLDDARNEQADTLPRMKANFNALKDSYDALHDDHTILAQSSQTFANLMKETHEKAHCLLKKALALLAPKEPPSSHTSRSSDPISAFQDPLRKILCEAIACVCEDANNNENIWDEETDALESMRNMMERMEIANEELYGKVGELEKELQLSRAQNTEVLPKYRESLEKLKENSVKMRARIKELQAAKVADQEKHAVDLSRMTAESQRTITLERQIAHDLKTQLTRMQSRCLEQETIIAELTSQLEQQLQQQQKQSLQSQQLQQQLERTQSINEAIRFSEGKSRSNNNNNNNKSQFKQTEKETRQQQQQQQQFQSQTQSLIQSKKQLQQRKMLFADSETDYEEEEMEKQDENSDMNRRKNIKTNKQLKRKTDPIIKKSQPSQEECRIVKAIEHPSNRQRSQSSYFNETNKSVKSNEFEPLNQSRSKKRIIRQEYSSSQEDSQKFHNRNAYPANNYRDGDDVNDDIDENEEGNYQRERIGTEENVEDEIEELDEEIKQIKNSLARELSLRNGFK